jgi:glycine betaine/choline ABC-type transport system substrate-binding protein
MDRTKTVACLSALLLASCSPPPQIVVGSKNFTEQALLAEIVAQQIERRLGLQTGRKFNLGGTLLAHRAVTSGAIDLYPEYSGTALTAVLKHHHSRTPRRCWTRCVPPTTAMAVELARAAGLQQHLRHDGGGEMARTRACAAPARPRSGLEAGVGYEFQKRPDGWPVEGLQLACGRPDRGPGTAHAALKSAKWT